MKSLLIISILVFIPTIKGDSPPHCMLRGDVEVPKDWITMVSSCTKKIRDQVNIELTAAMTYLAMGSHFLQDTVNRPGFAKFFLKSASEERQHALKLMEYLLMRGELTTPEELDKLILNPVPVETEWTNGLEALKDALALETNVTNKIRDIIVACEAPPNDYHLVDWLTADFLDEQYKGQRELAEMISTLSKMTKKNKDKKKVHGDKKDHIVLGEFLFDKTLL